MADAPRQTLWFGALLGGAALAVYVALSCINARYQYTWLAPVGAPGDLHSQRWGPDYWFTFALCLLLLAPLTAGFMADEPAAEWRRTVHVLTALVLLLHLGAGLIVWGTVSYSGANAAAPGNGGNPANDARWCCVYYALDPVGCLNTVPCPGVGPGDLRVDEWWLFKFWGAVVVLIALVMDLLLTFTWLAPSARGYRRKVNI
jgi:hypothetical protein